MTFRTRVAAAIGVVVAAAVFLACYFAYREARSALEGSADSALHQAFEQIYSSPPKLPSIITLGNSDVPWMFVDGQGDSQGTARFLKIDATIEAVAKGKLGVQYRTVTSDNGYALRELIQPIAAGTYVNLDNGQLAGQLASPAALVLVVQFGGIVDRLASLREDLLILAALGVVVAALFGWLATRAALVPLRDTTGEIEDIARTLDVSHRFDEGTDELGRLRRAFNRLLEEVERSQASQRQLILDASHELRTPLTSLRANAQVLGRVRELEDSDVTQLSDDMVAQVDELTRLVGDLTELTQGERSVEEPTTFDLADLVNECVEVAETHARTKGVTIGFQSAPCPVEGRRNRLARAVGNLLDNAVKFTPEHGTVDVDCRDGVVTVEDDGPGIDEQDRPHVFDRFYRSPRARAQPGSGLGLAIVAQVAAEAGGTVEVARSEALGGASIVLRLPLATADGFSPSS